MNIKGIRIKYNHSLFSQTKGRFLLTLFLSLLSFLVVNACSFGDDEEYENSEVVVVGQPLPPFCVQMNDSTYVSNHDLNGKPSIIVFFNTSCLDCRKELPIIQEVYEKYSDKIKLLAISRAENSESIEDYWKKENLSVPYSAQNDRTVYSLFAKRVIPRVYVSDKSGVVQNIFMEKVSIKKLQNAIDRLLKNN